MCKGFGIVHAGKGPHAAELRCSGCGKHKGWLDKLTVNRLLDVLAHFPEARNDVHIIRDQKETYLAYTARAGNGINSARNERKQDDRNQERSWH